MMQDVSKAAKELARLIGEADKSKADVRYGTVTSTGEGTVNVLIDGSDTPVAASSLMASRIGDRVRVSVNNHAVVVTGNSTAPATDDEAANAAREVADEAILRIGTLEADHVSTSDLTAVNASIGRLEAKDAAIEGDLTAATGRIGELEADHVKVADFQAEQANIDSLQAATADIDTIRANSAKVQNLTAEQLEADHATIGTLDTTYMHANMSNSDVAWISNGTIKDGAITNAMIDSVSANKLTAGTIDASDITVTNLNADNITTGTINGERIGDGSLSLDKLSEDVYTETEVNNIVDGLNDRIDGAIETWTGTAVPTLNNKPASDWKTATDRDKHVGDVYFVVNSDSKQNGYNYRFTKSGSTYSWQLIKDSDVTNALQRLTAAEGKITQFDSDISTLKTDTGTLTTRTTNLETRADGVDSALLDKVDTTTFNEVSNTVDSHSESISQMTQAISNKADSSTVTVLTTRVNKTETDISGINTTIGELQTTVESKADGSALTAVSNKLNTVSNTVDGHTQTISSVQNTLTTKADSSTVQTLREEYNETKTTVAGHETRLAKVTNTVTNIGQSLRNLCKNTASPEVDPDDHSIDARVGDKWYSYESTAVISKTEDGVRLDYNNATASAGITIPFVEGAKVADGETLTLSYTYRATLPYSGTFFIVHEHNPNSVQPYDGYSEQWVADGEWHDIVYSFDFVRAANAQTYDPAALLLFYRKGPAGTWVEIKDGSLVLERGATASEVTTLKTDYAEYKQTVNENIATIRETYATKEETYESTRPNLHPFLTVPRTDTDYWAATSAWTPLDDGWAHIEVDNSAGTSSIYRNVFAKADGDLKPNTEYTLLVEFRNVSASSSSDTVPWFTFVSNTCQFIVSGTDYWTHIEDGQYHYQATTKSDYTDVSYMTRSYFGLHAGESVSLDFRMSLYEGHYEGVFKPYTPPELLTRISNAETSIEQNASDILLRATKEEVFTQPNRTPFFSSLPYRYSNDYAGNYWQKTASNYRMNGITPLADGWAHCEIDNTSGTAQTAREIAIPHLGEFSQGDTATMLCEWRNVTDATKVSFYARNYPNQCQFHSNTYKFTPTTTPGATYVAMTCGTADGAQSWNCAINLALQVTAGGKFVGDVRLSLYSGSYDGPYKPYVGEQLYASQSELQVTNDSISSKVSTTDYTGKKIASLINQSASTVTIEAEHIDLNGSVKVSDLSQDTKDSISEASKTATDFVTLDAGGIVIGKLTDSTLGKNVLIDSDSVDIRNGSDVLASFGEVVKVGREGKNRIAIGNSGIEFHSEFGRIDEGVVNDLYMLIGGAVGEEATSTSLTWGDGIIGDACAEPDPDNPVHTMNESDAFTFKTGESRPLIIYADGIVAPHIRALNSLSIGDESAYPMKDYIVEVGSNSNTNERPQWRWIKFASGYAIAWGYYGGGSWKAETAWGALYYNETTRVSNPFTWAGAPYEWMQPRGTSYFWCINHADATATQTGTYYLLSPTKQTTARAATLNFLQIGRWK